jgi:hypothetical protein
MSGHRKMALLAEHAENIVNLRFRGAERVLNPWRDFPAFDSFRGRLPRLETLGFSHLWRVVTNAFEHAPLLRTVELGRSADLLELKGRLPLAQIRSLRLSASTSGYHLAALPNLTSLVSIQMEQSPPIRVSQTPPALQCLRTWHVEFPKPPASTDTTSNFFARFCIPGLRTLHIRRLTSVQGVIQLLRGSQCALTTLVLEEPLISSAELLHILADTPNLRALAILFGDLAVLDNNFFDALTIRNAPLTDILLSLTEFRVDGSYTFDTDFLFAMLESRTTARAGSAARLSKIDIKLEDRAVARVCLIGLGGTGVTVADQSGIVKI